MDSQDVRQMAQVAYVQSQVACAMIQLEKMKLQNEIDRNAGRELTYTPQHFEDMCGHFGIWHNQVVTQLWN